MVEKKLTLLAVFITIIIGGWTILDVIDDTYFDDRFISASPFSFFKSILPEARILSVPGDSMKIFNEGGGLRLIEPNKKIIAYDVYLDGQPLTSSLPLEKKWFIDRNIGDERNCINYLAPSSVSVKDFRFTENHIGEHLITADVITASPLGSGEDSAKCNGISATGEFVAIERTAVSQNIKVIGLELAQEVGLPQGEDPELPPPETATSTTTATTGGQRDNINFWFYGIFGFIILIAVYFIFFY